MDDGPRTTDYGPSNSPRAALRLFLAGLTLPEIRERNPTLGLGQIVSAAVASSASDNLEELYRTAIGERGQLTASLYRNMRPWKRAIRR